MNARGNLFFSVIIPTYNAAATISSCLESVCAQNFTDFEVCVIDGVSSDATIQIVQNWKETDNRIKFISEKDNGIYDAMNKGIRLAKGEWLYFLGSDDHLLDTGVLQKVKTFINENDSEVVYGDVLVKGNAVWAKDGDRYDGLFDLKKLLTRNICHQAIFYKKTFIDKFNISFDEKYPVCGDWDFNLHCWAKTDFRYMPLMVACFNAGGASTKEDVNDTFSNDMVEKIISYFGINSYSQLQNMLPDERMYLLGRIKKYKWRAKVNNIIKRMLHIS